MARDIPYPHPGEILHEEFLKPLGLSVYQVAKALHVGRSQLNDICRGRKNISAGVSLRLARYFDVTPGFFINLQAAYDLARGQEALAAELDAIEPLQRVA